MTSPETDRNRIRAWTATVRRYERHLSAAAMVVGFAVDSLTFGRVDHPGAHIIFTAYLALAVGSIAIAHAFQGRSDRQAAMRDMRLSAPVRPPAMRETKLARRTEKTGSETSLSGGAADMAGAQPEKPSRFRVWLPAATQFALGGLWSGFLVFYSRSAVLAASWPFLLLLLGFLVGNEVFRHYHSRLVFASLLLFFALYSYAVFVVPVFTKSIGLPEFLGSGALAILVYLLFLRVLSALDRARYRQSRWQLIGGALAITAAMNAFYFTGILPPLPLALSQVGVYHAIRHTGPVYVAQGEDEPWLARLGLEPAVLHVAPGQKLALFSAVFAPIKMTTRITHRWQWWDARAKHWRTLSVLTFAISGGREFGYRGYSVKSSPRPGDWRVDIDAEDGRLIGRLAFAVVSVPSAIPTTTRTLR